MIGWPVNNELERIWKEVVGMNISRVTGYSDSVFMVISVSAGICQVGPQPFPSESKSYSSLTEGIPK
jgi:hypothetical protein